MYSKIFANIAYKVLIIFIVVYALLKLSLSFKASLFITRPARLNVLFYGNSSIYYSLDFRNNISYFIQFDPEIKVDVPGGYDRYKIGSLGKLIRLENKPDILSKTFSVTTNSFIHRYFYSPKDTLYYENSIHKRPKPSIKDILMLSGNASALDRLFLVFYIIGKHGDNFKELGYGKINNYELNDVDFKENSIIKNSAGLLYSDKYREEKQSVQVVYMSSYQTAVGISSLLEGNGIKVSDINKVVNSKVCKIIIEDKPTETARDIASYFSCPIIKGKTDVYDIIFILGEKEVDWKIY